MCFGHVKVGSPATVFWGLADLSMDDALRFYSVSVAEERNSMA
jgi:hypothetical protein